MANPIRRLVQLVLDRASAKRTETEAKAALGGIDKSAGGLGSTFAKLGVLIAGAFSIAALKRFGSAAIAEAKAADLAWSNLRTTLANLGEDVETRTAEIKGLAEAMQAATTFEDDDIAVALTRVMSITGDAAASINNMGLVANVAAQFFDGDLAPAADLVAKAMMGQTRQLKQLGIEAGTAQEALQILADRSMNAAENRAATFAGKMETLSNSWGNFLEALGVAVVGSDETEGSITGLSGLIQQMTGWVEDNTDNLREWVANGLIPAIKFVNSLAAVLVGLVEVALTPVNIALSLSAQVLRIASISLAGYLKLVAWGAGALGFTEFAKGIDDQTDKLDANARALNAWSAAFIQAGRDTAKSGLAHIRSGGLVVLPPLSAAGGLANNAPATSKNQTGEEGDGTGFKFGKRTPGLIGGDVTDLKLDPLTDRIASAREALDALSRDLNDPVAQALAEHNARMIEAAQMTEIWGSGFDALGAEADSLTQALDDLAANGIGAADEAAAGYIERLGQVQEELRRAGKESELMGQIAAQSASFVSQAFSAGIGPAAAQKAKQNALMAVEEGIMGFVSLISPNPLHKAEAAGHFAAAKMFGALAASWGALAGASGGFSGGGGGSSGPSRTGDVGGRRSESMQLMGAEVSIYLVGEGFDAVNPRVQEVVTGAIQQAGERYGQNARIRVVGGR